MAPREGFAYGSYFEMPHVLCVGPEELLLATVKTAFFVRFFNIDLMGTLQTIYTRNRR